MQHKSGDAWYVLRCRENYWQKIQNYLHEAGLNTCCPLILEKRRRRDKKNAYRLINSPAFPGYIFVQFNPEVIHTTAIKRMPGAMDFVKFGNHIATVNQNDIEALKLFRPKEEINQNLIFDTSHLSPLLRERIEAIYKTPEPGVRIDLMFSMLAPPTIINRSRNAH